MTIKLVIKTTDIKMLLSFHLLQKKGFGSRWHLFFLLLIHEANGCQSINFPLPKIFLDKEKPCNLKGFRHTQRVKKWAINAYCLYSLWGSLVLILRDFVRFCTNCMFLHTFVLTLSYRFFGVCVCVLLQFFHAQLILCTCTCIMEVYGSDRNMQG